MNTAPREGGWLRRRGRRRPRPTRKSEREYRLMKIAGEIVSECHARVRDMVAVGVTTAEIDGVVEEHIRCRDAVPAFKGLYGFPASACVSLNEQIVHGIPGGRALCEGDMVTVDIGVRYRQYHGDAAWTYTVGEVGETARDLMRVGQRALELAVEATKPHEKLGVISRVVQEYVEGEGYSVVREYVGHGIGSELHEDPKVPNFIDESYPDHLVDLRPGMALAIEPMVNEGTFKTEKEDDGWTVVTADRKLSVHFEHTVFIHRHGVEILTPQT